MDATTLHQALAAAGLPVVGCDSLGNVSYARALTPAELTQAAAVIAAHTDAPAELPAIYADITLAGAQTATGFFCVDTGGATALTVTAKIRMTADTGSAANILPIGTEASPVIWNILLLREARTINHDEITEGASDPVYTILPVPFVAGACQFAYRVTGNKAAMCYVRERDFGRVPWPDGTVYQVKLIAPVQFVIFEAM